MYYCNQYGWDPYQSYNSYHVNSLVPPKCLNLPFNSSLCLNLGIKPTITLSVAGHVIASGPVNLLTKSATLNGQYQDFSGSVTVQVTDIAKFCGNASGKVCKGSNCKAFNVQGICIK